MRLHRRLLDQVYSDGKQRAADHNKLVRTAANVIHIQIRKYTKYLYSTQGVSTAQAKSGHGSYNACLSLRSSLAD
jgi:hypothetical protein